MTLSPPADIFDRRRRRARLGRTVADRGFVTDILCEMLVERLADIGRPLDDIVVIGSHAERFAASCVRPANISLADEDQLLPAGLAEQAFDAVVWAGGIEAVNDVPGALIQCRRLLRPGGVLLGCGLGAGSLQTLRQAMLLAEQERPVARFHPAIDVRAMGDLLLRCGFTMPMADAQTITARYSSLASLLGDLRADGIGNALTGAVLPMRRDSRQRLADALLQEADEDGRFTERFVLLNFTGWIAEA